MLNWHDIPSSFLTVCFLSTLPPPIHHLPAHPGGCNLNGKVYQIHTLVEKATWPKCFIHHPPTLLTHKAKQTSSTATFNQTQPEWRPLPPHQGHLCSGTVGGFCLDEGHLSEWGQSYYLCASLGKKPMSSWERSQCNKANLVNVGAEQWRLKVMNIQAEIDRAAQKENHQ